MEREQSTNELMENNRVIISGKVEMEFTYSHESYGEKFYTSDLLVKRISGIADKIPLIVSERLVYVHDKWSGVNIKVSGQFRSYNRSTEKGNRVILHVFATEVELGDNQVKNEETNDENEIMLRGYICKAPVYRKTPMGREITDFLLAVNRSYGKSDYIPCICWGRNARFLYSMGIGQEISVMGRIQSREYHKRLTDEEYEIRTAYEVSVGRIENEW